MKKTIIIALLLLASAESFASKVSIVCEARQAAGLQRNQVYMSSHHAAKVVADETLSFTVTYTLCPQNKDCVSKSYPIKLFQGSNWQHTEDLQTNAVYQRVGHFTLKATTVLTGDINARFEDVADINIT